MSLLDYASSDARTHWREVLDAAQDGRAVLVGRDNDQAAVINARRLRRFLAQAVPANAVVAAENGGFSIYLDARDGVRAGGGGHPRGRAAAVPRACRPGRFPRPAYELRTGRLWLRAAIEVYAERQPREPGRRSRREQA